MPNVTVAPGRTLDNAVTLAIAAGTRTAPHETLDVSGVLFNSGAIDLRAGNMPAVSKSEASFIPGPGATGMITHTGTLINTGVLQLAASAFSQLSGETWDPRGSALLTVAGVFVNTGSLALGPGSPLDMSQYVAGPQLTVTAQGSLGNTGQVAINGGAGPTVLRDDGAISNTGTIRIGGGYQVPEGVGNIEGDGGTLRVGAGGTLTNAGLIMIDAGQPRVDIDGFEGLGGMLDIRGSLLNTGTIALTAFRFTNSSFPVGADLTVNAGATLHDNGAALLEAGSLGTVEVNGLFINAGSIALQGSAAELEIYLGITAPPGGALAIGSTGTVVNQGVILVEGAQFDMINHIRYGGAGAELDVAGALLNTGTITVEGTRGGSHEAGIEQRGFLFVESAGSVTNEASGTLTLDGHALNEGTMIDAGKLQGAGVLRNHGLLEAVGASASITVHEVLNNGTVLVGPDARIVFTGWLWDDWDRDHLLAGSVRLEAGATLSLASLVATHQTLEFGSSPATLVLGDASGMNGLIAGFRTGDLVDLSGLGADRLRFADGVLQLAADGHDVASLRFAGHYTAAQFALRADGHGGSLITVAATA